MADPELQGHAYEGYWEITIRDVRYVNSLASYCPSMRYINIQLLYYQLQVWLHLLHDRR